MKRSTIPMVLVGLAMVGVRAAHADDANKKARRAVRATDPKSFERDVDQLFTAGGLTADAAANRAAKVSPAVRRKRATVVAADADLFGAKVSLAPVVSAKADYARLSPLDPVVLPLGGQMFVIPFFDNSYGLNLQAQVPLSDYLFRRSSLIESAESAVTAAKLGEQAAAAYVGQQTRETYYEWVRAQLQVLVARRQLVEVVSTLDEVRALITVDRASNADVLRLESQRAQAKQAVDKLKSVVVVREQELRLLIGADDADVLSVGEDVRRDIAIPERLELDDLIARAQRRRFELASIAAGIQAKEAQRDAEASAQRPKLSAFGTVDYANPNLRVFPEVDEFRLTWSVGLQISWVLNEALVGSAKRRRLAAEADELRADRTTTSQQVQLAVLGAYEAVKLASQALETSAEGIEAAEEGYRVRKDLFAANRATVVELVDAQTVLARARFAALDARIDLRLAIARLTYVLGEAP